MKSTLVKSFEPKPLKRSRHLSTLSHDHHDVLLFVWKIRQGMIYRTPATEIGKYCAWYWQNRLMKHFESEQKVFSALFTDDDILFNTMKDDHDAISRKMQEVIDDPSYFHIERLAQIIYHHVRFEERVWFPHVEQMLNERQLSNIGIALSVHQEKHVEEWTNEFWRKRD